MRLLNQVAIASLIFIALSSAPAPAQAADGSRTVRFSYSAQFAGLPAGQPLRVWVPIPHATLEQQVSNLGVNLPGPTQFTQDPKFHNQIAYCQAITTGDNSLQVNMVCTITRHQAGPEPPGASDDPLLPAIWLQPDTLVPAGGHTATLLAGKTIPPDRTALAQLLFDVVVDRLDYRKDKPGWGRGDAVWACDSRFGNCTDFSSLFISLARGEKLPAKFEIGFALPTPFFAAGGIDGYHCWAWFLDSQNRWTPVDPALAKENGSLRTQVFGHLDADRIGFTIGRDITLAPPQAGAPLNFFIYPYAEMNGQPVPQKNIICHFSFNNVH